MVAIKAKLVMMQGAMLQGQATRPCYIDKLQCQATRN